MSETATAHYREGNHSYERKAPTPAIRKVTPSTSSTNAVPRYNTLGMSDHGSVNVNLSQPAQKAKTKSRAKTKEKGEKREIVE